MNLTRMKIKIFTQRVIRTILLFTAPFLGMAAVFMIIASTLKTTYAITGSGLAMAVIVVFQLYPISEREWLVRYRVTLFLSVAFAALLPSVLVSWLLRMRSVEGPMNVFKGSLFNEIGSITLMIVTLALLSMSAKDMFSEYNKVPSQNRRPDKPERFYKRHNKCNK